MAKPFKDLNRKPTNEELEKGMADNLKKLEEIEAEEKRKAEELAKSGKTQDEDEDEEIEDEKSNKKTKDEDEDEGDSDGDEDNEDEDDEDENDEDEGNEGEDDDEDDPKKKEVKKTPKEEQDYKKRYSDSSSEAHILYSKNKKMADAISKAGDVAEPTEDELKAEYGDWDDMTDTEKRMAKRSLHDSKKLQAITESAKEFKDIDEWNNKVDKFLADPETLADHPQLEGKEEDFKSFVTTKQSRMGADFEDLVASFLYAESQRPKAKNKGKMFENGSGGKDGKQKPKNNKISVADSILLRKTNYKKYLEMLKAGKIEEESLD